MIVNGSSGQATPPARRPVTDTAGGPDERELDEKEPGTAAPIPAPLAGVAQAEHRPPRAVLARQAQQLRAEGKTAARIGVLLGVSRSYAAELYSDPDGAKVRARKASYGGTCVDCGKRTDGSNGRAAAAERCRPCYSATTKVWTRDKVLDAIHRFARAHGRPPVAADWNHPGRGDGYPTSGCVYRTTGNTTAPFQRWADAIEAAGFPRPRRGHTRTAEMRARTSESPEAAVRARTAGP